MAAQFYQITLDSETIGGGWKLYHYEPGTTTLKDVWVDRDKNATAAQPILADANGVVSFYGDGLYDLVAHNSADVLKYTWEDVYIVETPSLGIEGASIVSAATLVLGAANEIYYHITGTNTVQALSGSQVFVMLTFDSTPTLTDSATFQLRNRSSRQARADETVMFVNDGAGTWREVTPPIRLPNNAYLTGRNAAGSAEISLIKANASDQIELGTTVKNFSLDADPTSALQVATKQYIDNNIPRAPVNPIINGNMDIWQRATTAIPKGTSPTTYYADRWAARFGTVTGNYQVNRSTDVPTVAQAGVLFDYSFEVDVLTAAGATNEFYCIEQRIEGYNWKHFAQRDLVVSLWVKSPKTGTHCLTLANGGLDRSYVAEYTVNAANTWEYKTVTFPASPSTGTWDYTNGVGVRLRVVFCLNSYGAVTTTAGSWQNGDFIGTANQVDAMDNAANFFRFTGVKMELGSVATPIQFRTFQDELALCKRYYQHAFPYGTAPADNIGTYYWLWPATVAGANTNMSPSIAFSPEMRASPTVTLYNPRAAGASGQIINATDDADCSSSTVASVSHKMFMAVCTATAGTAVGERLAVNWASNAEL